jgi:hypothetical protein
MAGINKIFGTSFAKILIKKFSATLERANIRLKLERNKKKFDPESSFDVTSEFEGNLDHSFEAQSTQATPAKKKKKIEKENQGSPYLLQMLDKRIAEADADVEMDPNDLIVEEVAEEDSIEESVDHDQDLFALPKNQV